MESWNAKLTTAAWEGDTEALKLSLQNGADIYYQDVNGWTALTKAARGGHLEICRLLIDRGCKIDITMDGGQTALMRAAWGGRLEICRLLIDRGCKIDITDGDGMTALMKAAKGGHLEICRLLIDRGCKIDITDEDGQTALMRAARWGYLEVCRLLIDRGCKINITSEEGWTALMRAAEGGHLEICRLLIDRGCKIDITSIDGETALHYAAEEGHLQITKYLVEQGGASPLVKSLGGETPYDLAAKSKTRQYEEVMEYLKTVMSEKSSGVTAGQGKEDPIHTQTKSAMLNRLLGSGTYVSYDMRCMVTGQFAVGKSSLVKLLAGDVVPEGRHPTDGISLIEGRCGLDVETRSWICIDPDTQDRDVYYTPDSSKWKVICYRPCTLINTYRSETMHELASPTGNRSPHTPHNTFGSNTFSHAGDQIREDPNLFE